MAEPGAIVSAGSGRGAGEDRRSSARRGPGTREAIDRAALELFAQRGYHATSMRAIASAAEVQPAAIYHWYPGKEAILVGFQDDFMERLTAKVLDAVGRQSRPALRLAAAVWEHVVFHGIHRRAAFVTDSEIRALTEEPRRALIAKRDSYQEMFAAMIREGIEDGSLRVSDAARRHLRDPPAVHRGRALVRPHRAAGAGARRRDPRRAGARLGGSRPRADRRGDRERLP